MAMSTAVGLLFAALFQTSLANINEIDQLSKEGFQVTAVVYGVSAMAIGLLLLFFGIRLFRTVIATTGFVFFSLLTYIILLNVQEDYSFGPYGDLITLTVCVAMGVLGAVMGLSMWMLALVGIGALGGFGLSMLLLSWRADDLVSGPVARPLFIALLTVIGGLLAIIYERGLIIAGTAMAGAVSLCSGVDVFADTGFNDAMRAFLTNRHQSQPEMATYALLASCIVVTILGILIQVIVTGRDRPTFSGKK